MSRLFISGLGYISASLTVQKGAFEQRVSSRLSMMSVQMRTIGTISNGCSTCCVDHTRHISVPVAAWPRVRVLGVGIEGSDDAIEVDVEGAETIAGIVIPVQATHT